jgi:long-chain fatty acid transport protein
MTIARGSWFGRVRQSRAGLQPLPHRARWRLGAAAPSAAALSAALQLSAQQAQASGYHVDEQDSRATGRSGAVVARGENASAVYYNPAGLAELHGLQVQAGASVVRPTAEFANQAGVVTEAATESFVLPHLFAGWRASPMVALGFGVYSPYGLALDWPATSPGAASIRQAELQTLFITPAWALNLSRWIPGLSVGGGPDLVPAAVRLVRDIPFGTDVGAAELSGDAFGMGAHAGLSYQPPALPQWSFGIVYRTPVELDFKGDADFDAPDAYRGSLPPDGDVRTSLTLPQMLTAGVAVRPLAGWEIELDASWRGWSSYNRLDVELPGGVVQSSRKDWRNSYTLRLGTEYTFLERWVARVGGVWDQTPVPASTLDFQLPDADRLALSFGFGAQLSSQVTADLGALVVLPRERATDSADPLEPPVKGQFEIGAWVVGLSVGVELDVPEVAPVALAAEAEPCSGAAVRATAHLQCSR